MEISSFPPCLVPISPIPTLPTNCKMTHRIKRPLLTWECVPTREMCLCAGVSTDTLKNWRVNELLTRGIYWHNLPDSPNIVWVKDLVRDYIVNGNSPAHQRAIEKYLASLPSSDEYKHTAANHKKISL